MDEAALARFVAQAAVMIEHELESIALSRAWEMFNGYGLDTGAGDTEAALVRHVDTEQGWTVGSLAWNLVKCTRQGMARDKGQLNYFKVIILFP